MQIRTNLWCISPLGLSCSGHCCTLLESSGPDGLCQILCALCALAFVLRAVAPSVAAHQSVVAEFLSSCWGGSLSLLQKLGTLENKVASRISDEILSPK